MEEIEDSLVTLLSGFNTRTGRKIEACPSSTVAQDPAYIVFTLRDLSSEERRLLTLCILDVVEPWGRVGLPEATGRIQQALEEFWEQGSRDGSRTVYIPPKLDSPDAS